MKDNEQCPKAVSWRRFLPLAVGLVVVLVMLFTPVNQWLNQVPYLWEVLYPLMTLFGGFLVASAIRDREEAGVIAKWVVLFLAALSATLYIYSGDRLFYTLSRWGAFFFVAAEIIDTVLGVGEAGTDDGADSQAEE